ncbi:MAG: DUF4159 domain-containing protein [Melioribacteraceae bacterium]|nr:DUF4159 domain-containing protein [Melioribacteraceae bacterium]
MNKFLLIIFVFASSTVISQQGGFTITRLKYNGGGDWYNDPSAEVNLLKFVELSTGIKTNPVYNFVDLSTGNIFAHPFLFMTGHGNVVFSESDAKKLRTYLVNGGFLYVDDDYGLDKAFRREIKKVFPNDELVEIPFNYGLYNCLFDFRNGPPKTHEHDNKPAQGFGIFINGRLCLYFTYESNPSDGWADPTVHNNPPEKRNEALQFGANIIVWALSN